MAGVRLPIRTHPLHAFVTNDFEQGLDKIVASTELACYVSQTERGQMLIGAEFDSQPSFIADLVVRRAPELRLQDHGAPAVPALDADPPDVGRALRHLGRLQPDHGRDRRRRLPDHDRLGDVGLQGDPGRRRAMAERIATGRTPDLIAPFALDRFRRDHAMADQASARDALMHELDCPRCGRRPLDEFVFGGERRTAPSPIDDAGGARLRRGLDLRQPRRDRDRALVPRRRLPALADGPPRHLGRSRGRGRDDVRRLRRAAARDPGPRPGAVRRRRRRRSCRPSSPSLGGSCRVRRHRSGRRPVGRRRPRRRPAARRRPRGRAVRRRRAEPGDRVDRARERAAAARSPRSPATASPRRGRPRRRLGDGLRQGDRPPRSQSACCHVTWLPR